MARFFCRGCQLKQMLKQLLDIDWSQPPISFIYTLLIGLVGVGIYVQSYPSWLEQIVPILFFTVLNALAECLHVRLPHANGYVSVGFAICLASLLDLGPANTVFVASVGVVLANVFHAKLPLDAVVFNGGQMAITIYVTGIAWQALGGRMDQLLSSVGVLALVAAVAVYAIMNVTLVTISIALASRKEITRTWLSSIHLFIPNYIALGLLGILAAEIYRGSLGMTGVLLMWIPFLFARYSFQQYWAVQQAHLKTVEALAVALDARDANTLGHSERVATYARAMAIRMNLTDEQVDKVYYAGILHDIGKIGISDLVLNKKGRLNADEFDVIKKHPEVGANMVCSIGFLEDVAEIIRYHHKWFDGSGYPADVTTEQIPLGSRIIAVADAFDAMTCDRVYRSRLSAETALQRLENGSGSQFDGQVVQVFKEVWRLDFSNGEMAPETWLKMHPSSMVAPVC